LIGRRTRELADLDFADNISLFDENSRGMQQLIEIVETYSSKVGLHITARKTKLL